MLHHVVVGDGSPLLILHGSTLDHRHMMESLEPVFETLIGWKRIYLDMPGHGKNPPQADIKTQDDLLSEVLGFANEVLPNERYGIIGESRGSYVAQGIVHLHPNPVCGVALIVPGGSPTADSDRLPAHQVIEPKPALRSELLDEELGRFDNFMVVQRRDILEKARRTKSPARALWDTEQEARVSKAFDFSFHVRGETTVFDEPSLIIAGRQDSMSGYLDAIDLMPQFPRASLAVLDAAGHGLAWERPEIFNALVTDWLNRMSAEF